MTDVFISYKREERDKVILVADRLRALGLDVWFDARLTTGHHFDREIDDHVRTAKCVLVCWSPAALTSDWVRAEAAIGRERSVIVPVLVEACTPPVPFNTIQTESLIGWGGDGDADGWLRALERIGALTGRANLIEAERERGAREVETRRLQAMLDAQRREEEQAQRRAEAASAERTRLEAELASRGHAPPNGVRLEDAAKSKAAPREAAVHGDRVKEEVRAARRYWMFALVIAVLVVSVSASYFGGVDAGERAERSRARAALFFNSQGIEGYWCSTSYGVPFHLERANQSDDTWRLRSGYGLASEQTLDVEYARADTVLAVPSGGGARIMFEFDGQLSGETPQMRVSNVLAGTYQRCTEADAAQAAALPH